MSAFFASSRETFKVFEKNPRVCVLLIAREALLQSGNQYHDISKQFENARTRLTQEISTLVRRGYFNLFLGITTAIAGLVLLGYFVLTTNNPSKEPVDFVIRFFPRLTLVLSIGGFASFFLRLYKSSLIEIKYFQNEVTNMEAKYIALKTALNVGDRKILSAVVSQFGSMERNHILENGQSTVEIERARIDMR